MPFIFFTNSGKSCIILIEYISASISPIRTERYMKKNMQPYFNDIVQSVSDIIKFDSSLKPAEGNYPFGKETADCLEFFLNLATEMGFETNNYDNYIGEVLFGEGKDFGVLCHLDVVPAVSGWKYPPFGGVINDDISEGGVEGKKIWGRGTIDNKSSAIVCLYVLKALKDEGLMPDRRIKLIVGCNEESNWDCIKHYHEVASMPEDGFSPDADFPVIYAEKGIFHFTSLFDVNEAPMSALNAGTRTNMVCDFAQAVLTRKAAEKLVGYVNPIEGTTLSYDNTTNILRAYGKAAHGANPQQGSNALQALLCFLSTFNDDLKKAYDLLFNDCLQLKKMQDETGNLTLSPNMASFENGVLKITSDLRFPATFAKETIIDRLKNAGVVFEESHYQAPLYRDKESELVTTLLNVYNSVTGESKEPIAIGGGTYARALKNGVAFGPEIKGEEKTAHQANEYVTFERLELMSEVYYQAIKALCFEKPIRLAKVTFRRVWKK